MEIADIERLPTLGERIKAARERAGLNVSELQRRMGVAYTTVFKWEKNRSVPNRPHLDKLSVILGVPPSVLLQRENVVVTEPQYEAWRQFLETKQGRGMTDDERRTLGSMHIFGFEPTVETYKRMLLSLRMD